MEFGAFELKYVEDLSHGYTRVEFLGLPEKRFYGYWVAMKCSAGMVLFNLPRETEPSVLEFHNIGVVDDKREYFVITDKDKKPLGVWSRVYPVMKNVFRREY